MLEKLALISVLTSLATEAVKKIIDGSAIKCNPNALAALISVVVTLGVQFINAVNTGSLMTLNTLTESLSLVFLSFLTATLGYEKVIKSLKKGE